MSNKRRKIDNVYDVIQWKIQETEVVNIDNFRETPAFLSTCSHILIVPIRNAK